MTQLKLHVDNTHSYTIDMLPNRTAQRLLSMAKHLQRFNLRFSNYDNPYLHSLDTAIPQLVEHAKRLGIDVDQHRVTEQQYLNHLHVCYELGYNGTGDWLQFHEAIHMIENVVHARTNSLPVNLTYGDVAGSLDQPLCWDELETIQDEFQAGDCFVEFNELGKTPLAYWSNSEPDDVARFCALAKPMIRLNFKISIALADVSRKISTHQQQQFETWFAERQQQWCQHWQIPSWTVTQMVGGIAVGSISKVHELAQDLQAGARLTRLELV